MQPNILRNDDLLPNLPSFDSIPVENHQSIQHINQGVAPWIGQCLQF